MFFTNVKHHKTQFWQILVVMKNQSNNLSLIRSATGHSSISRNIQLLCSVPIENGIERKKSTSMKYKTNIMTTFENPCYSVCVDPSLNGAVIYEQPRKFGRLGE